MVEKSIIDWLNARGYTAYSTVPRERPARFVSVDATGGGAADLVAAALVTVDCWATSRGEAAALADSVVKRAVQDSRGGGIGGVGRIDVNAWPYWNPDPDSRTPRYRAVLEVSAAI